MGLNVVDAKDERARLDSFFSNGAMAAREAAANNTSSPIKTSPPPRPSRQPGRVHSVRAVVRFIC